VGNIQNELNDFV